METKKLHTPEGAPVSQQNLAADGHGDGVLQALHALYLHRQLCDYTIIAEGRRFSTHKNILASVSDYFHAMLTGSMMEAKQDFVELKGVTAHAVKALLHFAYTGQLRLNMEAVMEIVAGACHLQMTGAIGLCCDFMLSETNTKTCVDMLNMADMFSLSAVRDHAMSYIQANFDKVCESEQLLRLSKEYLLQLVRSDDMQCASELCLFQALLRWLDADREGRMQHMGELCAYVRFSLMRPEELVDQVSQTHLMVNNAGCRLYLEEALHYQLLPQRQVLMQTPRSQIRNKPCLVAFGGRYGNHIGYRHNSNKMYALYENEWIPLRNTETNFLYAAVAVYDNFMYVCGGMGKPAHARAMCQRYDPRCGLWTKLRSMLLRRQSFPLVAMDGKLYAFGGGTPQDIGYEHPPTDSSEVYSIDTNEWHSIPPLPERRKSCSACEHQQKIYLSGGRTETDTMTSFWCYSPEVKSWEVLPDMLLPHGGHAMFVVDEAIYVMDRNTGSVEFYSQCAKQWTFVTCPFDVISGVARPATLGPWVYFASYLQEDQERLCKRVNVLTRQTESLPEYPELVLCVISTVLTLPRSALTNNNKSD